MKKITAILHSAGIQFDDDPLKRCKAAYHMSVAYGFQSATRANLEGLNESVDMKASSSTWSIDLFSNDPRLSIPDSEVRNKFISNVSWKYQIPH